MTTTNIPRSKCSKERPADDEGGVVNDDVDSTGNVEETIADHHEHPSATTSTTATAGTICDQLIVDDQNAVQANGRYNRRYEDGTFIVASLETSTTHSTSSESPVTLIKRPRSVVGELGDSGGRYRVSTEKHSSLILEQILSRHLAENAELR